MQQNISRSGLSVTGSKVFNYFIIPKEPGKTELRKYLNWIYFNVKTARYDTLKPQFSFEVKGESIKNTSIKTSGKSEILEMANEVSDQLISKDDSQKYISWINYGVLLLLIITIFIILKK